jgi:hypothetical protein
MEVAAFSTFNLVFATRPTTLPVTDFARDCSLG